jgi:pimeloyl-ACP methyl ester carboxylesterase
VQRLRNGAIGGTAFGKVVLVGHSFGSEIVKYEAATYADVDGVIATGSMHDTTLEAFTVVSASLYPAFLDPKFASSGLAPGYLTTMPGTRGTDFYNTAFADPDVIALDETLKQTATTGEFSTIQDGERVTPQIHVPVLLPIGQQDLLFCGGTLSLPCANSAAILARESSHFSPQACLEAFVQPNSGHSINLHPNAHLWFEAATDWLNRRVGNGSVAPTQPCS